VLIGNGAFVDAHPEITQRLLKVELQALAWATAEANHDAFVDLIPSRPAIRR
jgi:sulfonate transport system substrate-binding protein